MVETETSSRNSRHCSTQEIVEMSASVNLATSQSAYSNPSTDPSYYDNTNLPYYTEPTTERQATYEAVDGQVTNYDDVEPKQKDIYQEIDQGIHYQPLNLNREVHYEGFVKPTAVAPEISKHPKDATRVEGQDVVFSCSVEGNPPPSVRWTKDGERLNTTANSRLTESVMNNNHSLTITDVHRSDAGHYRCVATNSVDSSTSFAATLKVYLVQEPPFNVTVNSKSSRMVNISWMAGFDWNSAILNYTVKISVDNQNFRDTVCQGSLSNGACVLSNSLTSASLVNLFPWTTYFIKVFARNIIGTSTGSSVVNTTTDEEGTL
ncbi:hypothetical protein OS493_008543 [Desmophyllum pertusum]|uniref:Uncharacterized protein n=1 Tax=Desmophyllum pertusum TaxID=174260 RepID=A0A9W9ZSN6_9CNID|nr:hypothetical protein OS493_008543 [Desmophyllum pertusum]